MDHTTTISRHAALLARNAAPDLATAVEAAAVGHLWAVDTGNDGGDSLVVARTEEDALLEVWAFALGEEPYAPESRGWSADRVTAIVDD